MWGLIIGACIVVVAIGLRVDGKVGDKSFVALLSAALISGIAVAHFGSTKKVKAGPFELEIFRKEANEITKEALERLKKKVVVHEEALLTLIKQAETTGEQLVRIAHEAAPPLLSLRQKEVKQVDGEYEVKLILDPSKNAPFAWLVFHAEIIGDTEASIKNFGLWEMYAWYPPEKLMEISDDGKKATIRYIPQASMRQRLFLKVSGNCRVLITGSRMEKPLELEIK